MPQEMLPSEFAAWRKSLGLTLDGAAAALGLSRSAVVNYEHGRRRGTNEEAKIPLHIALACWALAEGVTEYHGPAFTAPDPNPPS